MLRSCRRAAHAFGLSIALAFGAYAQPGNKVTAGGASSAEGQHQSNADIKPSRPASIQDLLQRIASAIEASVAKSEPVEERERANRDLAAQENMAKWAMWMLIATIAGVILGLFSLFLICLTVIYTRQAAVHAGEAVEEAKKTTQAAMLTIQSDRAWMTIGMIEPIGLADRGDVDRRTGIGFVPHFLNTGRSPAVNAIVTCLSRVVAYDANVPHFDFSANPVPATGRQIVGPNQPAVGSHAAFSMEELKAVFDGTASAFAYYRVSYTDIFGKQRYTECCTKIEFARPFALIQAEAFHSSVFAYRAVGPQNQAT